jgi:hypothetical protein
LDRDATLLPSGARHSSGERENLEPSAPPTQNWVEAFAGNHHTTIAWAEKGVRKEDHVLSWQRRMTKNNAYGGVSRGDRSSAYSALTIS